MSGSGSHPALPLSDALSARSYFEFGLDEIQAPVRLESGPAPSNSRTISNSPTSRESIEIPRKSGPHLRRRGRQPIPKESEKTETAPNAQDPLQGNDRPVRKRGRPRIETAKDAAAIEERRLQIRRAQRTYRQKKEATIQTLKTRVERLEQALQNVSDLLTSDVDLSQARPLALAEIDKVREFPVDGSDPVGGSTESLRDIFGYEGLSSGRRPDHQNTEASSSKHGQSERENSLYRGYPNPRSPSPLLNRLFPSTTIYTYSYQESCLSRRLQRFCLEHTYRWLTDPNTEPPLMSRVFGLFPCIQDMPGVRRSSRRVLQSEIGGSLEINSVAFYTLGGAGTHYPPLNEDGEPVYPVNARRPGKVLRRLARILRRGGISDWDEDWSGNREPDMADEQGEEIRCMSEEERLRFLDLDGDWFDCHDVEGYLEYRGFVLEGSSLSLEVPATTVAALYGFSPDSGSDYCASQLYVSPSETCYSDLSRSPDLALSGYKYTLNVECFFDLLLSNLRILGRAPGFRLWDVDAALRAAIHRHTF